MEALFVLLFMVIMAASNIFCFLIGARVGQKVVKGEEVKLPDPVDAIREHQSNKAMKQKMSQFETIMHNVDTYDGTGYGQRDVPRG